MSREAPVKQEPGGEVSERAYIKAEADWSGRAVAADVKQEPVEQPEDSPVSDNADAPCTAPCAGYCRRGALLDHTYATLAPADDCSKPEVGLARAWTALYAGHAVKDDLVLGPERVQRPHAAPQECFNPRESPIASERASAAGSKPRARLALKESSVTVRLESRARLALKESSVTVRPEARARGSDRGPAARARGDSDSEDETYEYATVDYDKDPLCDVCGRRFAAKSDLVNHVVVHIHREEESDDLPDYLWHWAQLAPRDCRVRLERCASPASAPLHPSAPASAPPRPSAPASAPPRGHGAAPRRKRADALLASNIYVCDICEETFNRKRSLISHIKMHTEKYESPNISKVIHRRNHAANGPHSCECKKAFKKLKHLLIHIRIRTGGKLYSCAICKQIFPNKCDFKSHTRIHTGETPFLCKICKQKFKQLTSLNRHKAAVHNVGKISHSCEICNHRFSESSILKTHKLIHTGEKPYSCEVCGRRFTQSSTLTAHSRIHTGEKPYPCKICKRRFRKLSDVYRHKRLHTGEMPHSCEICGKLFIRLCRLTDHLKFHADVKQVRKGGRPRKRSTSPLPNCGRRKSGVRPRETAKRPRIRVDCAKDDIHREDVQDDMNINEEVTKMYIQISSKGERQRWRRVEANLSSSS